MEVINAGIVGFSLVEQRRMLRRRVAPLRPDLVIVYPGFNDFAGYCRRQRNKTEFVPRGLPALNLPSWVLSVELLRKNTGGLRELTVSPKRFVDASRLDLAPYTENLQSVINAARTLGIPLVLATNARSYRPGQPLALQQRLSQTARYYNDCFDLEGLHVLYARHNAVIRNSAAAAHIDMVDLEYLVPGGDRYFEDSSHFSDAGEIVVADVLADFLSHTNLLPRGAAAP